MKLGGVMLIEIEPLWKLTVHPKNPVSHKFWKSVISEIAQSEIKVVEQVEDVYDDALAAAYLFEVR